MTQEEINIIFNITILIHEDEWFGKRKNPRDREEVQEWVAKQLANNMNVYTIPRGMSWGGITTEEKFNEYWNENSKIKD